MRNVIMIVCCILSLGLVGQEQDSLLVAEELAVRAVVDDLFDAMRAGDSARLRTAFHPEVDLETVFYNKKKELILDGAPLDGFLKSVGTPHEEVYDERIGNVKCLIDGPMALIWVPYHFYVGDEFSHCGVNSIQMIKVETGWKILNLLDTRRRGECPSIDE